MTINPSPPCLDLQIDGKIARVIFNNPAARNALTWPMYEELKQICEDGARIMKALGSERVMTPESVERKSEFRRSIVTSKPIKKGHIFALEDLTFKRPGTGLDPEFLDLIVGRTALKDIDEDELLDLDDF